MVSDGSKRYGIKPLSSISYFSGVYLIIFFMYFGKVVKIHQEIITVYLLQKKHENKMITQKNSC